MPIFTAFPHQRARDFTIPLQTVFLIKSAVPGKQFFLRYGLDIQYANLHTAAQFIMRMVYVLLLICLAILIGRAQYPEFFDKALERLSFSAAPAPVTQSASSQTPSPQQAEAIQKQRSHITQLEYQYFQAKAMADKLSADFTALQKSPSPGYSADPVQLNAKATAYEKVNQRVKEISREVSAEKQKLAEMLPKTAAAEEQTAAQPISVASAKPPRMPAPPKKVVIYTTLSCPACVKAKNYLAKKGIFYREIDVNGSREVQKEFQSLGGSAVPLILIGETRIVGFNSEAIDAALK